MKRTYPAFSIIVYREDWAMGDRGIEGKGAGGGVRSLRKEERRESAKGGGGLREMSWE